jgi:hypothetical protein
VIIIAQQPAQQIMADTATITGSLESAKAAQEQHVENTLIIRDKAPAMQYTRNWQAHLKHSTPKHQQGVRPS